MTRSMKISKPVMYFLVVISFFTFNIIALEIVDEPDPFAVPMTESPIQSDEIPMNLEEDYREDTLEMNERIKEREKIRSISKEKPLLLMEIPLPSAILRSDSVALMLLNPITMD